MNPESTGPLTRISRSKLYPTPGTNPRFAWRWLYRVNGNHECSTIAQARGIARRLYPGTRIVEEWKMATP